MPRDTSGEWQLKFLERGTHLTGEDLSIMIGTVSEIISSQKELWLGRSKEEMEKLKVGVPEFADKYLQGCEITLKNSNEKKFDAVSMKDIHNETLDEAVSALSSLSEGE